MQENRPEITREFISLERILEDKNKNLLSCISKPVLRWFKRLLCLDKINAFIYEHRDLEGVDFANVMIKEFGIKLDIKNPENVPLEGRPLVVANHPIGSMDGIALISIIGQKRKDVLFPVNDILCYLPTLRSVFVPINKYGKNSQNHNTLKDAFESQSVMMFFPAGTESKPIEGRLQDFPWKKSFVRQAQTYKRDIIPVHIQGGNSKGFYRLFKIRRFFGIKFDLEMILLPREMFRQKGKTITLTFGKRVDINKIDKRYNAQTWAKKFQEHVYRLEHDKDAEFITE